MKIDKHKEQELWAMWQENKNEATRNELLELYLPQVRWWCIKKHGTFPNTVKSYVDVDELLSEVAISLMRSIELFEPERGLKFTTYIRARVNGAILDYQRQIDHLSRSHRADKESHQPGKCSLSKKSYERDSCGGCEPYKQTELWCLLTGSEPDHHIDAVDEVESILASLPTQLAAVVSYYDLDGMNMRQVGQALGISDSRVSQIHREAMSLMREILANRDKRESVCGGLSG